MLCGNISHVITLPCSSTIDNMVKRCKHASVLMFEAGEEESNFMKIGPVFMQLRSSCGDYNSITQLTMHSNSLRRAATPFSLPVITLAPSEPKAHSLDMSSLFLVRKSDTA